MGGAFHSKDYALQLHEAYMLIHTACAFTGYRPNKFPWRSNEDDPACIALKQAILSHIVTLTDSGIVHYLCGMACGADQYCAAAVLKLREDGADIKLHCILPCKNQSDKWTQKERTNYKGILEQADSIIYVNREESKTGMMERNRFLVNYSSITFAICKNTEERRSGTAATVRYARNQGRELYILNPLDLSLTHEPAAIESGKEATPDRA